MIRVLLSSFALASVALAQDPAADATTEQQALLLTVPVPDAKAYDQRPAHVEGCGPTSVLNAFAFGAEEYQAAAKAIKGNQTEQIKYVIRRYGVHASKHRRGRLRWDFRYPGLNVLDLGDIMKEAGPKAKVKTIRCTSLFTVKAEKHKQLLKRSHTAMAQSMKNGLPPVLSLRRFARTGRFWQFSSGHYVMLHTIPKELPEDATGFKVKYIDPWGGHLHEGTIQIPKHRYSANSAASSNPALRSAPALECAFPNANFGKQLLKANTPNIVILEAAIGDFSVEKKAPPKKNE